ncbi:hypothetical protein JNB_08779 [Janibacter sp. HTCC2649]|nr:hypothetical protein JNB_08779 [Janibacter sp. HTCC2649]
MTSLVNHPRFPVRAAPTVRPDRVVGRARRQLRVTVVITLVMTCLVAGAIVLVAVLALATIDTGGRVPHPLPLPAPTGQSVGGS